MELRIARIRAGFKTAKAVAAILEVHPNTVRRYEKGETKPNKATLEKLATLYHCSVDELQGKVIA